MIDQNRGGGARQRAWNALREAQWESVEALARNIGCSAPALRNYIRGLEQNGYIKREVDGTVTLVRDTGQRSPAYSIHTGDFRDWNLDPAMSATELREAINLSGLSIRQWLIAKGLSPTMQTRVRQMMNGQRPVQPKIARAARMPPT